MVEESNYLQELFMALCKALRNIGFVRDSHVRYLDRLAAEFREKEDAWNSVTTFSSFSKVGVTTKVVSYLGAGSLVLLRPGSVPDQEIPVFFILGTAGAIIVPLFLRLFKPTILKKARSENRVRRANYWVSIFKRDMTNMLYDLYSDSRNLAIRHFPSYGATLSKNRTDDILTWTEEDVRHLILNTILPPDDIAWP